MKKLSVFTGVFNEEEAVRKVYEVIKQVFASLKNYEYEHIFLDNCSTDRTLSILKEIAAGDKQVKVLSYSKNFGPIKNEFMGYRHSSGDAVIGYEGNLKDPPELILSFIKYWEDGYDVVYGVRNKTADNFVMAFMRKMFYHLSNFVSEEPLPLNAGVFRLVDRKVVNELIKIDDYKPYVRGLIATMGYKQIGINYERKARPRGKSKSNLGYLIDFTINALVSYSIVPIRFCTYLGVIFSVLSFGIAIFYGFIKIFYPAIQAPGVTTVIILILFFSGIQLFFLGVVGEYICAIHFQVRQKPFVIIKEKINFADS